MIKIIKNPFVIFALLPIIICFILEMTTVGKHGPLICFSWTGCYSETPITLSEALSSVFSDFIITFILFGWLYYLILLIIYLITRSKHPKKNK